MYRYLTYNANKSKTIQYFMIRTLRECFAYDLQTLQLVMSKRQWLINVLHTTIQSLTILMTATINISCLNNSQPNRE